MQSCLIIYRYFILAILISSIFFTELIAYSSELDSTIEKGDKYYNDFSNLSALKEYTKAYGLDPKNFEVLMKITRAYNDVGEDYKEQGSAEAEGYFIKAFEHSEIMKELFPQRGETYFFMAATRGNLALFKGGKEKVKKMDQLSG